jgi:hypothetical protein
MTNDFHQRAPTQRDCHCQARIIHSCSLEQEIHMDGVIRKHNNTLGKSTMCSGFALIRSSRRASRYTAISTMSERVD